MKINLSNIKDPYNFSFLYCFFNLKDTCVFTSQKVCTRSFYKLVDEYQKAKRIYEIDLNYNLYSLVRNPYLRVESMYRDKFHKSINTEHIQHCQKEIIKVFGEDRFWNKNITFEEFVINGLEKLVYTESHFFPQSMFIPEYVKVFYKIENESDLQHVFSLFGSDVLHEHRTYYNINTVWTYNMKTIIQKIYSDDFTRFDYKT